MKRVTNALPGRQERTECRLRVLDGPDVGLEVELPPVGAVLGADPGADVVLSDGAVSGRHLKIAPAADGFRIEDLGSTNGTLLDGVALERATVPAGAVLKLGETLMQLLPALESVEIPPSRATSFGELFGKSDAMRRAFAVLESTARSPAPALLLGESGTGKELAARAIHTHSDRREGPFVTFDCGAASETLIQSDLFGHVRGAFTGAQADRVGAFAAAHGGTLFLDEIGDLPLEVQPKLLRLLETGEVTPLGTHVTQRFDVRIVAATHRDLWEEVASGAFRGDLYYRLAVVEIRIPPLRRRPEDLPDLVRRFLERAGAEPEPDEALAGPNLDRLLSYHWPGNVRELRNVITRAVALAGPGTRFSGMPILLRGSPQSPAEPQIAACADRPFHEVKAELLERFERSYLEDLLRRAGGNLSEAARSSGLARKYLYRILDKHNMRPSRA